jgi:HD-GYP domain-containing protein (c-di-GMP phosphodiesterase class II)
MDRPEVDMLMLTALLREAASFRIPFEIREKEGPLTDLEQAELRENLESGVEMISRIPDLMEVASHLRYHYENFDGSGHPNGFAGDQIPIHSRVLAITSAYEAMTSSRGGRPALNHADAIASLKGRSGTRFDPSLVAVFSTLNIAPAVKENDRELVGA